MAEGLGCCCCLAGAANVLHALLDAWVTWSGALWAGCCKVSGSCGDLWSFLLGCCGSAAGVRAWGCFAMLVYWMGLCWICWCWLLLAGAVGSWVVGICSGSFGVLLAGDWIWSCFRDAYAALAWTGSLAAAALRSWERLHHLLKLPRMQVLLHRCIGIQQAVSCICKRLGHKGARMPGSELHDDGLITHRSLQKSGLLLLPAEPSTYFSCFNGLRSWRFAESGVLLLLLWRLGLTLDLGATAAVTKGWG